MDIGSNIKKYRKAKNMTQVELARKINKSESMIRKYESNSVTPNIDVLESISAVLDVSLNEFFSKESYSQKANREYYNKLSDDELIDLLSKTNLSKEKYINLSNVEKKKIIDNLLNINPLHLRLQNHLDNFQDLTKQQLVDFFNEVHEYYCKNVISFITKDYSETVNDFEELLKLAKLQEKRIKNLENTNKEYKITVAKYERLKKFIEENLIP